MVYQDVPDSDAFIAGLQARGIDHAVIAWRAEYGQVPDAPGVVYDRLQLAWLLAYDRRDGCIVRCALSGADADRALLRARLLAAGITAEERDRNTVGWG
ncbi:MAG: hypothetical protein H0W72_09225 [Planctomycetes bacterium]|nr:hypothetical protein [Planctomycetota bacterium]